MEEYNYIKKTNLPVIIWCAILCFTIYGLIYPLCLYFIIKSCKYYYDNEKLIIETGVFIKRQNVVPLYRIINITAQDNIFNYGFIRIQDKGQILLLKYISHSKEEMMKLTEKWENAKKQNIKNEVI